MIDLTFDMLCCKGFRYLPGIISPATRSKISPETSSSFTILSTDAMYPLGRNSL